MKIAIFSETYFPFISGVVTHIEMLKNCLEENGHEVLIVTMNPKARCHYVKDGVLYCPAIPLKKIYGYGISNPLNIQRLLIVKDFNPDILHIHTEFSMGIFGIYAAKKLKIPIVYTLHTMYDDYMFYVAPERFQNMVKPAAHLYFKKTANKATEIIGPSPKVAEFLRRCGVEKHINIIPNNVDLSNFMIENVKADDIVAVKKKLGINDGDTSICFVGRLGKEKSIDVLIEYFSGYFKDHPTYKLFIIGDGPEKDNLNAQVIKLGMKSQIQLLGPIKHDEIPQYYHSCNLFATASLSEMNSISMLEAMASGLYVLQRLDIFNKDQISCGENGDLYETAAEFAVLVKEEGVMDAQQRAKRSTCVTDSTKKYGKQEFINQVLNVYQRAIVRFTSK